MYKDSLLQYIFNVDFDFKLLRDISFDALKFMEIKSDYDVRNETEISKKHRKKVIPSNTKIVKPTPKWSVLNRI